MGSYGIKIAKDDKTVDSSNPNDFKYWSRYNGLTLVDSHDIVIDPEGSLSGTETHAHGLGYAPFVFCKYTDTTFDNSLLPSNEVLPTYFTDGLSEGGTITCYDPVFTTNFTPIFAYILLTQNIDDTDISVNWEIAGFEGGGGYSGYFTNWTVRDIEFTVTVDIYTFELGRTVT